MSAGMKMVPRGKLLQLLGLLPMRADHLADMVDAAVHDNPLLERAPGSPCLGCGRHTTSLRCRGCSRSPISVDLPASSDWRSELASQVRLELPARLHGLVDLVVGSLTDRGLLDRGLFARDGTPDPRLRVAGSPVSAQALQCVIDMVRHVGPAGVAASSPTHAVRLQVIELVAQGRCLPLLLTIVEGFLPEVAAGEFDVIADRLACSPETVEEAVHQLRSLVRPTVAVDAPTVVSQVPDVVFSCGGTGEAVLVEVADARWFGVERVPHLWRARDASARSWAEPYQRQAEQLLTAIEARANMLRRVAAVLAERQRHFLLHRSAPPVALLRAEVARELAVHPSTVGRAVKDKWARRPDGRLIPLSDCFGACSTHLAAVGELLRGHPDLTDRQVGGLLAQAGLPLARRTVAHYRQLLGIPARGTKPGSRRL
jgi:RNA polymerase sigma-54 factor